MNRIEMLASLCKGSQCVCDIGCDHAYVLLEALTKYDCLRGIAADVAAGPLSAAKDNICQKGLENRISIVLSDGFKNITEEFDTAVIAGMGGYLIQAILDASLDKIKNKRLILEPNNDAHKLREYLSSHEFVIVDEFAIMDMDKYYEILVVESGNGKLTENEILYGPILLKKKEEAYIKHYEKKRMLLLDVIKNVKNDNIRQEKEKELKSIEDNILN